jgi:hypothetical protein
MRTLGFLFLFGILFLCSSTAVNKGSNEKHKKKNINLNSIIGQVKLGFETNLAIIYLGQLDTKKKIEKLISRKKHTQQFDPELINEFNSYLDTISRLKTDLIIQSWKDQEKNIDIKSYMLAGFLDQWVLKDLILERKVEVWNKSLNIFEKKITYHFVRDRFGSENCYYTFQNGLEFHNQILTLGE